MVNLFLTNPILSTEKRGIHYTSIFGQPGAGKSRLMESWIMQDNRAGEGLCLIDPHGDLFQHVLTHVADFPKVWKKVVVIDPLDPHWAVPLNPLHVPSGTTPERIAWSLSDIILKIWKLERTQAPRMTWMMGNTFSALAELRLPLTHLPRFLLNSDFRDRQIGKINNYETRIYFEYEFPKTTSSVRQWAAPLQPRISGQLSTTRWIWL